MEKDVVCGMQIDPAKAAGKSEYKGEDLLLLFAELQSKVRRKPVAICEVARVGAIPSSRRATRRAVVANRVLSNLRAFSET